MTRPRLPGSAAALRLTANCSILFPDLPLLDRPAAARAAGFDAVEFWWPFDLTVPDEAEVAGFTSAVLDAGVELTGLNLPAGDMPAGERGILSDPSRSAEFRDGVAVAVAIGARLGVVGFNALYGNRLDGVEPADQDALATENLAFAGEAVAAIGATLLIEPLSGVDRYPLRTAAQALAVVDRVREEHGVESLRLLADLYHLATNGDDVDAVLDTSTDRVGHVQIADAPGRGEPGTGELPLQTWLEGLAGRGYAGLVGLEYRPVTADPFAWLHRVADRA
ncbi:TIM barrel protein [Pseudonocardia ailaonensis]|uniref:TIM barrel protein n=1 Tax=Pseudonocardia ailaonensis TaxID=367279 RepID=A0ABN2NHS3_9PSEU